MERLIKISGVVQLDFRGFLGGLKGIQEALKGSIEPLKSAREAVRDLIENGKGLFDSVKEGFGSSSRLSCYITPRGAEALVRNGQFSDFNELDATAPCHYDPLF